MSNGIHNVMFMSENIIETFDNTPTLFCGKDSEGSKNLFLQVKGFSRFNGRYKIAFAGMTFPMEEKLFGEDDALKSYSMYKFFDKVINRRTLALFSSEGIPLNSVYVLNTGDGSLNGEWNGGGVSFISYNESTSGCEIHKIGGTEGDIFSEVLCFVGSMIDFTKARNAIRDKIEKIYGEVLSTGKCDLYEITGENLFYRMVLKEQSGYACLVYNGRNEFVITPINKGKNDRAKEEVRRFLLEKLGGL